MAHSLENQKKLAEQFMKTEEKWDIEGVIALRTDDCLTYMLPQSLGHPSRDNKTLAGFYSGLKAL